MNAVFVSCLFVVAFVAAASAHHLELCKKNDQVLATELDCIKHIIPPATNAAFDTAVQALGCSDRSCAMRKMCEGGDLVSPRIKVLISGLLSRLKRSLLFLVSASISPSIKVLGNRQMGRLNCHEITE
uniref:Putative microplusin 1 n=1 Tax=Amblyomma cajennense TaxID=34607 RepID=A0A023FE26_AMBCJ